MKIDMISDFAIYYRLTAPLPNSHALTFQILITKSAPTILEIIAQIANEIFLYIYNGHLWHLPTRVINIFCPSTLQGLPTPCSTCIRILPRPDDPVK